MWGIVRVGAFIAVLVLAVAACGGDDPAADVDGVDGPTEEVSPVQATQPEVATEDGSPVAGGQTEDAATPEAVTPEDEVLAAYRAANAALEAAFDPADANHPDLLATYDGEALSAVQDALVELKHEGHSYAGDPIERSPDVTSLEGDTAVIQDCFRDRYQIVETDTGKPVGEPREDVMNIEVNLERIDGAWKIVKTNALSEPCSPG